MKLLKTIAHILSTLGVIACLVALPVVAIGVVVYVIAFAARLGWG